MNLPHGVELAERKIKLLQPEDTCGRAGEPFQYLELEEEGFGVDDSGTGYLVIKTDRWAMNDDEIDGFAQMLKDFLGQSKCD